jgi:hypothetical protein
MQYRSSSGQRQQRLRAVTGLQLSLALVAEFSGSRFAHLFVVVVSRPVGAVAAEVPGVVAATPAAVC